MCMLLYVYGEVSGARRCHLSINLAAEKAGVIGHDDASDVNLGDHDSKELK